MDFNVDDLVVLAPEHAGQHGQTVWKVRELPKGSKGVNYKLDNHTSPGARGLRAPGYMLRPAPADGTAPQVIVEPFAPLPPEGTVVTVTCPAGLPPRQQISPAELFVVFGTSKGRQVNITRLGGHPEGRYWRVPPAWLTVVPLTEVADKIAAHLAVTT